MTTTIAELPIATGIWTLDRSHSSVAFSVRHLAIARLRGRFDQFDARVVVGATLAETTVRAELLARSIDTDVEARDQHLRGPDFLHVAVHPRITFVSTAIVEDTPSRYHLTGDLTLNGVTRTETLVVTFHGIETFDAAEHAGFDAVGAISRKDYGLDWNGRLANGGAIIGDRVGIELDVELQRSADVDHPQEVSA